MRKKELWMRKGARVLLDGRPGVITWMTECTLDNVEYVTRIGVMLDGGLFSHEHHPDHIQLDRMQRSSDLIEGSTDEFPEPHMNGGLNV